MPDLVLQAAGTTDLDLGGTPPPSLDTPTSLAGGSSTGPFSFTPTAPTSGARLILTVVTALSGAAPLPSSISGLGVTWTQIATDVTANGTVRLTHYSAIAGAGSGAVTASFGTSPDWWAYNLAQFTQSDGGTPTIPQSVATQVDLLTSSGATLASAPASNSITFGACGYNAGSGQSLAVGGGFTTFAARQSNSSPAASLLTEYDATPTISQTSAFTSGNGSGKIYSAIEIGLGDPPAGGPQFFYYNGSTEVPLDAFFYNGSTEVALTIETV